MTSVRPRGASGISSGVREPPRDAERDRNGQSGPGGGGDEDRLDRDVPGRQSPGHEDAGESGADERGADEGKQDGCKAKHDDSPVRRVSLHGIYGFGGTGLDVGQGDGSVSPQAKNLYKPDTRGHEQSSSASYFH